MPSLLSQLAGTVGSRFACPDEGGRDSRGASARNCSASAQPCETTNRASVHDCERSSSVSAWPSERTHNSEVALRSETARQGSGPSASTTKRNTACLRQLQAHPI